MGGSVWQFYILAAQVSFRTKHIYYRLDGLVSVHSEPGDVLKLQARPLSQEIITLIHCQGQQIVSDRGLPSPGPASKSWLKSHFPLSLPHALPSLPFSHVSASIDRVRSSCLVPICFGLLLKKLELAWEMRDEHALTRRRVLSTPALPQRTPESSMVDLKVFFVAPCLFCGATAVLSDLRGWRALSSGVLTVAPCACCVNLYVCMYNVRILRVFPYFYHCLTLLVFSCLLWISNKSINCSTSMTLKNRDGIDIFNLYVCMYKVSILGVFWVFFITVSLCQYFPVFSVFDF